MNLEKLQQEAEALQKIDATKLPPEQLSEFINKLASILNQSEESMINTTLLDLKLDENE